MKYICKNCGNGAWCYLESEKQDKNINEIINCKWHSKFEIQKNMIKNKKIGGK